MFLAVEPCLRPLSPENRDIKTFPARPFAPFLKKLKYLLLGIPFEKPPRRISTPIPAKPTTSPPEGLARYLMLSPKTGHAIRPAEDFSCEHPDGPLRVIALIEHLFVRYPTPLCLYRTMLTEEGLKLVFPNDSHPPGRKRRMQREAPYRRWFHTVARGESLAEAAKNVLTRREAHWFIQAPSRYSLNEAILWARAAAVGVPSEAGELIVDRFRVRRLEELGPRLSELFHFFARAWNETAPTERIEIIDYVSFALWDPKFSLAGRTAGSVRKLSEEWHRRRTDGRVGRYVSWHAAFSDWDDSDHSYRIKATELIDNVRLAEEGASQSHCVSTYAAMCVGGQCRIVSMRWLLAHGSDLGPEVARLTLEIRPDRAEIVQIRGRHNRRATEEQMGVVRRWAAESGLTVSYFA